MFRVRSSVQLSVTMGTAPRRVYLGRFSIPVNKDDMLGWTWPAGELLAIARVCAREALTMSARSPSVCR